MGLRDIRIGAERPGLRDAEEERAARVYQGPGVHITHGDHSVERSLHNSVALHLFETRKVGLGRRGVALLQGNGVLESLHSRDERLVLRLVTVVFLPRHYPLSRQVRVPLCGCPCEFGIGLAALEVRLRLVDSRLRLLQGRLRLPDLLIHFGRFNLGEGLAGFDAIADIGHTAQDISVGACQDRRFGDGLDVSGQLEFAAARRTAGFDDFDAGQRALLLLSFGDTCEPRISWICRLSS